jgi:hypothetical protein
MDKIKLARPVKKHIIPKVGLEYSMIDRFETKKLCFKLLFTMFVAIQDVYSATLNTSFSKDKKLRFHEHCL